MRSSTGGLVARLIEETDGPLLVVAPYITRPAFRHLLGLIEDRALAVVTEWSIRSVATGATDPRIYHDVTERRQYHPTQLSLLPRLHGKLYMTSQRALVGSTNLTANGTGWFGPGNLELLVEVPADNSHVKTFVNAVKQLRTEATAGKVDAVRLAAKQYKPPQDVDVSDQVTPLLRSHPREFAREYTSGCLVAESVINDAHALNVPEGLDAEQLVRHLQTHLRALAFYDLATTVSRRTASTGDPHKQQVEFQETAAAYGIEPPKLDEAGRLWAILMEWMNYLFPHDFSTVSTGPQLLVSTVGHF